MLGPVLAARGGRGLVVGDRPLPTGCVAIARLLLTDQSTCQGVTEASLCPTRLGSLQPTVKRLLTLLWSSLTNGNAWNAHRTCSGGGRLPSELLEPKLQKSPRGTEEPAGFDAGQCLPGAPCPPGGWGAPWHCVARCHPQPGLCPGRQVQG